MTVGRVVTILSILISIVYPFLIYFGISKFSVSSISAILLGILAIRFILVLKVNRTKIRQLLPLALSFTIVLLVASILKSETVLKLIPVAVNLVLLSNFGFTLFKAPSMIERFASLTEDGITESIARYCFKVTIVWCIFFIINGLIALYTAVAGSWELWTLYNGFVSYLLIGTLMGIEYLVRIVHKRKSLLEG